MIRLALIGNPENRRVTMFLAAAHATGLPQPKVYAWRDILRAGEVPGPAKTVRIDSPGENPEVDRLLRATPTAYASLADRSASLADRPADLVDRDALLDPHGASRAVEHGEIFGAARSHAGLGAALRRIAAGGGRLLSSPDDILTMSDKPRCHARLLAAGVPVPAALPPVDGWDSLRKALDDRGWHRVFVKPSHGSSASGVIALTVGRGRVSATTSVELAPDGRLFNNLRIRRYDREADVATIVDRLAPDGLHVERWFPKAATTGGRTFDLRVVVIAGRPRHIVVRTSRSPMTNLHLGNARGDLATVRQQAGPQLWAAALNSCVQAARCFPQAMQAGVDLMIGANWRSHAVAEVNAFGDLLPGVLDSDGQDTYTAQLSALADGSYQRWTTSAPQLASLPDTSY